MNLSLLPRAAVLLAALFAAAPLSAWGVLGHQLVAVASVADLPPGLAAWFAGREDILRDHASDPDHWKHTDPLERPRHYLECEPYGGPDRVPLDEGAARTLLGPDAFQEAGQAPWTILDRVQVLADSFASGDPDQVALDASILCHYVGDLSVPLHTTVNRHGDRTGQRGIHKRWHTCLVERMESDEGWIPEVRPAGLGPHPQAAPWAWLKQGFALLPGLLADDLAAQRADPGGEDGGFGEEYWRVFRQAQEPHVKEQLTLGAQRTAQMILLAWTRAGRPAAPAAGSALQRPGNPN
jgi:hypothetical protein